MLQLLLLSRFCYSASAVVINQILLQCFSCCYYLDYVTMTLLGHNLYSVTVLQLWPYSKCCYSVSAIVIFQWCYSASAVVIFHCFYSVFILFCFRRQLLRARGTFFYIVMLHASAVASTWAIVHSVFFQASAVASTWDIFFTLLCFRRQLLRARGTLFTLLYFRRQLLRARGPAGATRSSLWRQKPSLTKVIQYSTLKYTENVVTFRTSYSKCGCS